METLQIMTFENTINFVAYRYSFSTYHQHLPVAVRVVRATVFFISELTILLLICRLKYLSFFFKLCIQYSRDVIDFFHLKIVIIHQIIGFDRQKIPDILNIS